MAESECRASIRVSLSLKCLLEIQMKMTVGQLNLEMEEGYGMYQNVISMELRTMRCKMKRQEKKMGTSPSLMVAIR